MRLIIKDNYDDCSLWAANYIAYKIQTFRPTPKKTVRFGPAHRINPARHIP